MVEYNYLRRKGDVHIIGGVHCEEHTRHEDSIKHDT